MQWAGLFLCTFKYKMHTLKMNRESIEWAIWFFFFLQRTDKPFSFVLCCSFRMQFDAINVQKFTHCHEIMCFSFHFSLFLSSSYQNVVRKCRKQKISFRFYRFFLDPAKEWYTFCVMHKKVIFGQIEANSNKQFKFQRATAQHNTAN